MNGPNAYMIASGMSFARQSLPLISNTTSPREPHLTSPTSSNSPSLDDIRHSTLQWALITLNLSFLNAPPGRSSLASTSFDCLVSSLSSSSSPPTS